MTSARDLSRFALASLALAVVASARPARSAPAGRPPTPAASGTPAPPQDTPAESAAKLRAQGNDAMIGMRYTDALVYYEQAAKLAPDDAGLDYSMARAHQLLGDYPEALSALERFDARATPEMKAVVGNLDVLFAQARPRVGTLVLACDVPGARVIVRNRVIGTTPLPPTRLGAGGATVQVELEGFFTETRDVVLPGGGSLSLEIGLHAKNTSGLLSVRTDPLGASVQVDGRASGTTTPRIELALAAGPHEIVAAREGYDVARVPIFLAPGASRDIDIPMSKSVPFTSRWWFWTGVGVVVAGGVATAIALTTERHAGQGTLTPGQVGAP